jgi:energy-converting hydrogenase Eha subunit A
MGFLGIVVALPATALLLVLNKKFKGKPKNKHFKISISLAILLVSFVLGCGIAYCFLGHWIAAILSFLAGILSAIFHQHEIAVAVPFALAILAIGWATADIAFDRKADKGAQISLIILPVLLCLMIGGQFGASGSNAVSVTFDQAFHLIGQMGGA